MEHGGTDFLEFGQSRRFSDSSQGKIRAEATRLGILEQQLRLSAGVVTFLVAGERRALDMQ
jgi:hypothetical protein